MRNPRLIKSHLEHEKIAKGGKYIYVARNPEDAFVSYFHFLPAFGGLGPNDLTDMNLFFNAIWTSHRTSLWDHYMGWYKVKDDPNVLWVFFEDMKSDFRGQIERVAEFMEIPEEVREKRVEEALEKASFKFMSSKKQKHHFDDHFFFDKVKVSMGFPEDKEVSEMGSKVRHGKTGRGSPIPRNIRKRMEEEWKKKVTPETNCKDYDSFRASFKNLRN